jgi:arylsulfatase A-like enzyme
MKYIANQFKYMFALVGGSLIFIFLPADIIFRIDSMRKVMGGFDIVVDISIMSLMLSIVAVVLSLLIALIFTITNKISIKLSDIVIKFIMVIISAALIYHISKMAKLWLLKSLGVDHIIGATSTPVHLIMLLAVIVVAYYASAHVIKSVSQKSSRILMALMLINVIAVGNVIYRYETTINQDRPKQRLLKKPQYNVIIISMDSLAFEDTSLSGYKLNTTPNIEKFTKESFVFDRMISNANWTKPGVTSIITGVRPSTHFMISGSPYNIYQKNGCDLRNLPSYLLQYGYDTSAVVSNEYAHPWLNGTYKGYNRLPDRLFKSEWLKSRKIEFWIRGYSELFLGMRSTAHEWLLSILNELHNSIPASFSDNKFETENPDSEPISFKSAENIMHESRQPLFMWVHLTPPHAPYLPGNDFKYKYLKGDIFSTRNSQIRYIDRFYNGQDQALIDKLRLRYDEQILNTDSEVGKFINMLRDGGYLENTIVIMTSDHGESFEHLYQGHCGPYLYNPMIHIPLLIHLPGQKYGKTIKSNAEQVDIAPTIIELLKLPMPESFEGESLVPAMRGEHLSERPKFSMQLEGNKYNEPLSKGSVAVILGSYKYIYNINKDSGELYNLISDPSETRNLANTDHNTAAQLRAIILDNIIKSKHKNVSGEAQ